MSTTNDFRLHIIPRFLGGWMEPVEVVDLTINEFGLKLIGGRDITVRRPFPNKRWSVVCRKRGRSAMNGILLDMPRPDGPLTVVTRWAVQAELVATHRVTYRLLDNDHDAASQEHILWYCHSKTIGGQDNWERRDQGEDADRLPVYFNPQMEMSLPDLSGERWDGPVNRPGYWRAAELKRRAGLVDFFDDQGFVRERVEKCSIPTIERDRFGSWLTDGRMPPISDAFQYTGKRERADAEKRALLRDNVSMLSM